jgi:hypothetical protein
VDGEILDWADNAGPSDSLTFTFEQAGLYALNCFLMSLREANQSITQR